MDVHSATGIDRRQFLKGSAFVAAAAAGLSTFGCAPSTSTKSSSSNKGDTITHNPPTDEEADGTWVAAACWHNCGGRCMNKVMVKDGVVIRQKTDDTHEDSFDYPQQRGCIRGKVQQQQCFGADRILHPLKRKGWSPDNPNGEMRGKDEWEVISWDEAIKYTADEYKKIKDAYGNQAFLVANYGSRYDSKHLLAFGGHTSTADTTSWGTYLANLDTTIGINASDFGSANDRLDMLNADTILFHASNPTWSAAGTPTFNYIRAKEAGVKFICIDPIYNASAQMLDAEWIPVRTGTDTALFLAVAYEMLRLDDEEGDIIDWDFLDKYTVGFDADHKPADLKDDVNFVDYVKGAYDGTPKTPEWATEICGTPTEKIMYLARELGKTHNVWMMHNYAAARNTGAENLPQLFFTVGLMGGHLGKPGNCIANNYHANCGNGGGRLVKAGSSGLPTIDNAVDGVIVGPQVWEACLTGKYHSCGDFYNTGLAAGEDKTCDIHCIVHDGNAYLQTGPNMKVGIEAHRKMDFVMTKAQFMTTQARYSDIILPVTTEWERDAGLYASNREFLYCASKVTEPLGEAKTDQEIDTLLLEALGVDPATVYPISEEQQYFNQIAGATVIKDDGSGEFEPLVTITEDDIAKLGVEGEAQQGRISFDDFVSQGGYQVARKDGDGNGFIGYSDYIEDPDANPRDTPSGKFEICSQSKADLLNSVGFSDHDYKAYPEYIVPEVGYETTFENGQIGGAKGEYPYLLFNPHYLRRSHSVFDNCPWLREAWANPVFLSRSDAEEKGIANGDTVHVWTKFGDVLRNACVMDNLMPGEVGMPHGAWVDVDEDTGIDKAGADNYLLGNLVYGIGLSGYNNNNCNFEKYDGEALGADCDEPQRLIAGATATEPEA